MVERLLERLWTLMLGEILEGGFDFGAQQIEVKVGGVIGLERVETEPFPPCARTLMHGCDDHGAARGLSVQLGGGCENVDDERGPDTHACVVSVNGKATKQESGDGVGSTSRHGGRRGALVDGCHCEARVCGHLALRGWYDPSGGCVPFSILAGVEPQPFIEFGLTALEAATIVFRRVERLGSTEISQSSGNGEGVLARLRGAR